ncbi:MAG: EAL domain-containing response regulator [Pseudomonadota bacterium]
MADKRLLILDDDLMVGKTIAFIAENVGWDCIATDEPQQFFTLLEKWQPTHIVLDLVMPKMDGVEVMVELSHRGCKAQIIISSGVGSRVLDAASRSAAEHDLNIVGILSKPFKPSMLQSLLNVSPAARRTADDEHGSLGLAESQDARAVHEAELQRAIEEDELFLVYQPKIDCLTNTPVGFEALVRWQHPQRGLIMPNDFIPMAESSGLIDPLTDKVVQKSLSWFATHFAGSNLQLSVNISARNLKNLLLADRMADLCASLGMVPGNLICELTETSTMEDPVASLDLLTRLRLKGFLLSIDDFGTGFSSMLQLVRLPFSEIKIDKSFVMTALQSGESRAVIRSIVELGQSLSLCTSAEGVEDPRVLEFLRSVGCERAQGYLIARPMEAATALDWYYDHAVAKV